MTFECGEYSMMGRKLKKAANGQKERYTVLAGYNGLKKAVRGRKKYCAGGRGGLEKAPRRQKN